MELLCVIMAQDNLLTHHGRNISMEINKNQEGSKLSIALVGRLDTVTSPQLQEVLDSSLNGITDLLFDFAKLDYISSAGLRVLLTTNKKMVIRNVNDVVQEVFDMTGFADILNIE